MEITSISNARRIDGRLTWTVEFIGYEDEAFTAQYRTNAQGEGLWIHRRSGTSHSDGTPVMEWRQILGTSEFGGTKAELRDYLERAL